MSLRAILVLLVSYGAVPFILVRPFIGLLVFSWLAYGRPQDIAWGLSNSRISFQIGAAMLVGLLVASLRGRERWLTLHPQTILLLALGAWFFLTGKTAVFPRISAEAVSTFSKIILVAVITTGLVRTRQRFRVLLLVIGLSLGFLGLKYAVFALLRGGARFNYGPGGFIGDNNHFALALCMAIPMLWGMAMVGHWRAVRVAAAVLVPLTAITILFTFSRGGLLTLVVVAVLLAGGLGRRILLFFVIGLSLIVFLLVASDDLRGAYTERATSIADYQSDPSAQGRLAAWKTSLRMSRDYPILGVGPDNFLPMYDEYSGYTENRLVTHNSFLQFLAENGIPAVGLFVSLLCVTVWRLERLRRRVTDLEVMTYARMLSISILAYVTGGMFLDMAYFDLLYHLTALGVSLEVISQGEVEQSPERQAAGGQVPWWEEKTVPAAEQG